jgi:hypothetical protein
VALDALLRFQSASWFMPIDTARYVVEFWRGAASSQSFALRRPHAFRAAMEAVRDTSIATAIDVLFHAAAATGTKFSDGLAKSLRTSAEISS